MDIYYFLNGLIILMVGLLGGFPFAKVIKRQPEKVVAWRVVHSGGSMGGVMLIAIGAIVQRVLMSPLTSHLIFWGFIISTYALVAAMVVAAFTGERGVGDRKEKSTVWKVVYYAYGLGAILSIFATGGLILVCIWQIE